MNDEAITPRVPDRLLKEKERLRKILERPNVGVAYFRVSDDDQNFGESPELQKAKIESFASDAKIKIVQWFGDGGVSGKTVSQRKELKDLISYCKRNKGKVGYVIVYNMRRASRDTLTYYADLKKS